MSTDQVARQSWVSSRWARLSVGAAGLSLAVTSCIAAFAASARGPQTVAALPTGWASGEQHGAVARALFAANPQKPPAARMLQIGKAGLEATPLSAESLSMIGIAQQTLGRRAQAERTFAISLAMTRRDLMTHLWFANYHAERNDVQRALAHYDLAMRTSYNAPTVMIPLLARAIRDPGIRDGLARLMAARPPWLLSAADNLTALTPHPRDLALAFQKAGGLPEGDAYRTIESRLIDRLIEGGDVSSAGKYYLSIRGVREGSLQDARFLPATVSDVRGQLAWRGVDAAASSGAFVRSSQGYELQGSAAPSDRGPIAERTVFLPPGRYTMSAAAQLDGNADAAASVAVACWRGKTRELVWESPLGQTTQPFTIADLCAAQHIAISLDSGSGPLGAQAVVSGFQMKRL